MIYQKTGKIGISDIIIAIQKLNKDIEIDEEQKVASFVQLQNDRNTLKNKEFDVTCVSNIVYAVGKQIEQKYRE